MNKTHENYLNSKLSSKILFNELMSKHNTFGIGGKVNCFIYPNDKNELSMILKFTQKVNFSKALKVRVDCSLIWPRYLFIYQ